MVSVKRKVSLNIDMYVWDCLGEYSGKPAAYKIFEDLSLLNRIRNLLREYRNDLSQT
jgi:hypothetical protein